MFTIHALIKDMDRDRKKYEARMAQGNLGVCVEFWYPPKALKVKDVFPHLTIDDHGGLFVRGLYVGDHTIKKHWSLFRDLIDEDVRPKVYAHYKKAIDVRARDAG